MKIAQIVWKIIALVLLAAIAATVSLVYVFVLKPKPVEGEKTVQLAFYAKKEGVNRVERYEVRTAQNFYNELLFVLNEDLNLKLDGQNLLDSGYITEAFGYKSDYVGMNNEYFTILTDYAKALDTTDEYFNWMSVNGRKVGMSNFGSKDLPMINGSTYVFALVDKDTTADFNFVIDSPVVKVTDKTVAIYDSELKKANDTLIPVLVITGVAILAVAGLFVLEAIRAKKYR